MYFLSLLLLPVTISLALPPQTPFTNPQTSLPVVLWHGLGDSYSSSGMSSIAEAINSTYPDTFVHSIFMDEDPTKDRNAGFFGHVADQVPFSGMQV
jgi:palmitoyl-protein thioesterase